MSRRRDRARGEAAASRGEPGASRDEAGVSRREAGADRAGRPTLATQIGLLVAVFAVAVGIAKLAGAANLGVAFGIGQIAFALSAVYLLVKR